LPNAIRLNAACMMAVMAARDRNLPRDEFQGMLEKAVDLQRMVIRLQTLEVMVRHMQKEGFAEEIKKNVDYCAAQSELCRKNLEHQMNLVAQCPWRDDTIN